MTENETIAAYPLYWPPSFRRLPPQARIQGKFGDHSLDSVRSLLQNELRLLRATGVVLSTNIPLRKDGNPMGQYKPPSDPGVAVYFQRQKKNLCLACDAYTRVETNLYALVKTIEAMRGIERWRASDMLERMFTGFAALTMPARKQWWDVLGVEFDASVETIKDAYRKLAPTCHPDHGGDPVKWHELSEAYREAIDARNQTT